MKSIQLATCLCLGLFLIFGCHKKESSQLAFQPCDTSKHYKLLWSEEFNYNGLADSSKWGYEVGFVRNHEAQYYTHARKENARVENGMLVIESKKENFQGAAYTSASLNTLGKVSFPVNSRIEVRAKIPQGQGIWPAIWMMGTDIDKVGWPKCGEIDIMEFVGHTPNKIWGTFHWWDATKPDSSLHLSKGNSIDFTDLKANFHVYGLERTAGKLSFFVDNQYYFSFDTTASVQKDLFTHPYYVLLNTAIGGDWGGKIDDAIFPQKFYIDWVRVFEIPSKLV
jgi:beta-glucanase (GH16 family)